MAPFIMAFAPAPQGKHHPGPWKTTKGGLFIDIVAELFLPAECHLDCLDRLNTIWWIAALLRLRSTTSLYVPVVSSERFASIPAIAGEFEIWPVEIHTHRILPERGLNPRITEVELGWLKDNWQEASCLLVNEDFANAIQAVDSSIFGRSPGLALVSVWGALERLFSSSNQELSFRVAANIASYLEPPGRERYKYFKQAKALYDRRSKAAHGSDRAGSTDSDPYVDSFAIARRVLLKMIENRHVPEKKELEAGLFGDEIGIVGESTHIQ